MVTAKSPMKIATESFKKTLIPLGYATLILSLVIILQPSIITLYSIILGLQIVITIGLAIYKREKFNLKRLIKNLFFTMLILTILIFTSKYLLLWYGILGYIIFILGYVAYRLIKNRKEYMEAVRQIETLIFGRTLDRKTR